MTGERLKTKKRLSLFLVFLAFTVGVAISLFGLQSRMDGEDVLAAKQPKEELFAEEDLLAEPVEKAASEDLSEPEAMPDIAVPVAGPESVDIELGIDSAGTGEPFDEADLEWVRLRSPEAHVVSGDTERDIMDSLDPKIGKVIEETKGIVDEIDEKALDVTAEILEAVPFLNLKPEKAEIRPDDGGATLSIELSPEALGIGKKEKTSPSEESPDGDPPENQTESPESGDQDGDGAS